MKICIVKSHKMKRFILVTWKTFLAHQNYFLGYSRNHSSIGMEAKMVQMTKNAHYHSFDTAKLPIIGRKYGFHVKIIYARKQSVKKFTNI